MRILDLYAGLGGEQRRAEIEALGHEYITLDFNPKFNCDITADIFEWDPVGEHDFIWASPPCPGFSVAALYRHWNQEGMPRTKTAIDGMRMVLRTLDIIGSIDPPAWIIENPRGMLRNTGLLNQYRRRTVTYCQYGENRMKPTDLWGVVPGWISRPLCRKGDPCHEAVGRGTKSGTQGMSNSANRAIVPLELWLEILNTIEGIPTARVKAPLLPTFI